MDLFFVIVYTFCFAVFFSASFHSALTFPIWSVARLVSFSSLVHLSLIQFETIERSARVCVKKIVQSTPNTCLKRTTSVRILCFRRKQKERTTHDPFVCSMGNCLIHFNFHLAFIFITISHFNTIAMSFHSQFLTCYFLPLLLLLLRIRKFRAIAFN